MPPQSPQSPAPAGPNPNDYNFILNPQKAPAPRRPLPGGSSLLGRVVLVAGGIIVVLVIFSFAKNLLGGTAKLSNVVTVAQDQQELIHLTSNVNNGQQGLSTNNTNLAATVEAVLSSNQSQVLTYLSTNHNKVKTKVLNQKVSASLDTQLTNAQAAGTYDQTFQEVMKNQIGIYMNDLQRAFAQDHGKKGRALLSSDYSQAQLLLNQTTSASPSPSNLN